jgi:transaldolase
MKDQKKNPLQRLFDCGQSCWLDNLTRKMIDSGDLIRRTREQGVRAVTSNPNIFNEAISNSDDYDSLIKELSAKQATPEEIYEVLTIRDVQDACDQLRPIYETSHGTDGFVSLEVSPWLAHDADGTMEETRRLFEKLQRPNAFIKIPGSPACVPAIEPGLRQSPASIRNHEREN